ncbi:MAG: nuclear transport factor 2 family protein [Anaerolineaceae bacterium]|nr:nuclear transport factor 2 family protein [Anaerolineaceae bacterium]
MKKIVFFLISAILIFLSSCKTSLEPIKVDVEAEKEAIKAVIFNETQSWIDKDMAKFNSFYIQDDYQTRVMATCDTMMITKGWSNLSQQMSNVNWSGIEDVRYTKDFMEIKVMDNTAWAIYKENQTYKRDGTDSAVDLLLTMVLEKKEGTWKISCFSIYYWPETKKL